MECSEGKQVENQLTLETRMSGLATWLKFNKIIDSVRFFYYEVSALMESQILACYELEPNE